MFARTFAALTLVLGLGVSAELAPAYAETPADTTVITKAMNKRAMSILLPPCQPRRRASPEGYFSSVIRYLGSIGFRCISRS